LNGICRFSKQREIQPDREFDGAGDDRIEQRVEHASQKMESSHSLIVSRPTKTPVRPMRSSVKLIQTPRNSG